MSDVMLLGVLKMPYEMAMANDLSRLQFYQRVQQLVAQVEAQPEPEPQSNLELWEEAYRAIQNCLILLPQGKFKAEMNAWLDLKLLPDEPPLPLQPMPQQKHSAMQPVKKVNARPTT